MARSLKIVVILLLVALLPARAIGSVTLGICASGQQQADIHHYHHDAAAGEHADQGQGGDRASGDSGDTCGYCAAHCVGIAFVVPTGFPCLESGAGADLIPFGAWSARGFFPDRLDRPPLLT